MILYILLWVASGLLGSYILRDSNMRYVFTGEYETNSIFCIAPASYVLYLLFASLGIVGLFAACFCWWLIAGDTLNLRKYWFFKPICKGK